MTKRLTTTTGAKASSTGDGRAANGAAADAKGVRFNVAGLRVAVARAAGVPVVSRPLLATLIGAHPNSIALWEAGRPIRTKFLDSLRELNARIANGGKIELPATGRRGGSKGVVPEKGPAKPIKRRPGRPKKAVAEKAAAKPAKWRPGRPKKATSATSTALTSTKAAAESFDVRALRTKLGASRVVLAKLLGVSAGSILNWEARSTSITKKNDAKLRQLGARAERGQVTLPERRRGGRPRKASAVQVASTAPAARGRPSTVSITGDAPILYANVLQVTHGDHDARVRFAVALPGGETRAVVDVLVPANLVGVL